MLIKEGATLVLPQLSLELGSCEYFHTFCLHFVRFRSSRIVESVPIVVVVQLGLEFRKRLVAGWQVLPIREYIGPEIFACYGVSNLINLCVTYLSRDDAALGFH